MTNFPHLRAAIVKQPWAILPERLEAICEVVERRCEGIRLSAEEIASHKGERPYNGTIQAIPVQMEANGGISSQTPVIAVINIMGIIAQHASQVDDISGPGGTSTERVSAAFRSAMANPSVTSIILNINSPGGSVYGVQELADLIHAEKGKKPVVAQVNSVAASAAYWLATAADEIVVTPSGEVGSIGVYALHGDVSEMTKKQGVKYTFISAGKYKVEGNPLEPLTDEAATAIQASVNGYYDDFVKAVSRGRKASVKDVREGFGQGRMERAAAAVKQNMADRVGTLDATIARLSRKATGSGKSAESLIVRVNHADDGVRTYEVEGTFPEFTSITRESVDGNSFIEPDNEAGQILFVFTNGSALYEIESEVNGSIHARLVEANIDKPAKSVADVFTKQTNSDKDAWRRRRYAHNRRLT